MIVKLFNDEMNIIKWTIDGSLKSYLYTDESYHYNRCCSTREYDLGRFKYMSHIKNMKKEDIVKLRDGLKIDLLKLQEYIKIPFTSPINLYAYIDNSTISMILDIILRHYICINKFKDTGCHEFWEIKLVKAEKKFSRLLKDLDKFLKEIM